MLKPLELTNGIKYIFLLFIILSAFISAQETGARYLIITHDTYYDAITPFAEWKTRKGLKSKIVKLSEIGSDSIQIRNYIVNAYNTWEITPEYLLLVGNKYQNLDIVSLAVYPNLTRQMINIRFSTGHPDRITRSSYGTGSAKGIELKIYDVSGRLVKDFSRLTLDAQHSTLLSWDGMDDNNRRVAQGVYFVRLVIDRAGQENYQKTKKIIFLK